MRRPHKAGLQDERGIAAAVLGDFASCVPEADRERMIEQLRAMDYDQLDAYLAAHVKGEPPPIQFDQSIFYGTLIFSAAFSMGDRWVVSGKIERDDFRLLTSEVMGALQGLTPSERSAGRIDQALDRLRA